MFDFHEKRKISSVVYSRPVIGVVLLVTILLSISAYNRYTVAKEMEVKLESRKQELEELRERARAIESKVEYLTDERGVEEELRNRFDAIREGEQVIILLEERGQGAIDDTKVIDAIDTGKSFWQSLIDTFKF